MLANSQRLFNSVVSKINKLFLRCFVSGYASSARLLTSKCRESVSRHFKCLNLLGMTIISSTTRTATTSKTIPYTTTTSTTLFICEVDLDIKSLGARFTTLKNLNAKYKLLNIPWESNATKRKNE